MLATLRVALEFKVAPESRWEGLPTVSGDDGSAQCVSCPRWESHQVGHQTNQGGGSSVPAWPRVLAYGTLLSVMCWSVSRGNAIYSSG